MFYVALRRDGDGSTRAIRVTESARIAGYNARVRVRGHTRAVTVIRRALWYRAQRGGYMGDYASMAWRIHFHAGLVKPT